MYIFIIKLANVFLILQVVMYKTFTYNDFAEF